MKKILIFISFFGLMHVDVSASSQNSSGLRVSRNIKHLDLDAIDVSMRLGNQEKSSENMQNPFQVKRALLQEEFLIAKNRKDFNKHLWGIRNDFSNFVCPGSDDEDDPFHISEEDVSKVFYDVILCLETETRLRGARHDSIDDIRSLIFRDIYKRYGSKPMLRRDWLLDVLYNSCQISKEAKEANVGLYIAQLIDDCDREVKNCKSQAERALDSSIGIVDRSSWYASSYHRPLSVATMLQFHAMCKLLVDRGANVYYEESYSDHHAGRIIGVTCLFYSMEREDDLESFVLFYNAGLRHAIHGQSLSQTIQDHKISRPLIYQYCLEQGIIQNSQQATMQEVVLQEA